jgi:uncharacterized protein YjbI with pentapeptide repeats
MQVVETKLHPGARRSDLSGSRSDDVNISGWRVHNANLAGASISDARLDGATIGGVPVTDLLAFWRAGHEAKNA